MPRARGQVIRRAGRRGAVFAIRFRAYGHRHYVTLGSASEGWTRAKAETELENVLADVRRGIWRAPEPEPVASAEPDPSFHVFASEWLAARKDELAANTVADYTWQLSNHLLPFFAGYRLSEISVEAVDRYRTKKVRDGELSATSVNKTITRLAQILDVAVEYGHIERNVAKGRRRRLKASKPRRTWLDRADQIEALLAGAAKLDAEAREPVGYRRPLLATLTFAGLRLGEALALKWREVDLAGSRLGVVDAKTAAGIRTVDLLPVLREELADFKARCGSASADSLVFSTSTGRPHSPSNVRRRVLATAMTCANEDRRQRGLVPLPEGLTPHSLRRTFASLRAALGDEIPYVMQQLGHTNPTLTLSVYAQVMYRDAGERERLRELVERGLDSDSAERLQSVVTV